MKHSIEPMRIADFDEVTVLWKRTEGVGLNESDERANIALFLERNPGLSLVARDEGGKIIGAVLCGQDGRRGYLHHLAVAAECRRRGIGGAIIEKCLAALAAQGIQKCNLFLFADNAAGREFWERRNWKERVDLRVLQKPTG